MNQSTFSAEFSISTPTQTSLEDSQMDWMFQSMVISFHDDPQVDPEVPSIENSQIDSTLFQTMIESSCDEVDPKVDPETSSTENFQMDSILFRSMLMSFCDEVDHKDDPKVDWVSCIRIVTPNKFHHFSLNAGDIPLSLFLDPTAPDHKLSGRNNFHLGIVEAEVSQEDEDIALLTFSLLLKMVKPSQLTMIEKIKVFLFQQKIMVSPDKSLVFSAFGQETPKNKNELLVFLFAKRELLAHLGLKDLSVLYG